MFKIFFRPFEALAKPQPDTIRREQLLYCERALIDMEGQVIYTRKMAEYYRDNIKRLSDQITQPGA